MLRRILIAFCIVSLITLIGALATTLPLVIFPTASAAILFSFQFGGCCALIFFGCATLYEEFEDSNFIENIFLITLPILGGSCALGALIGSLICPGIGTVIGAMIGLPVGFCITAICCAIAVNYKNKDTMAYTSASPTEYISTESEDVLYNAQLKFQHTAAHQLFDGYPPPFYYHSQSPTPTTTSTSISREGDNADETESSEGLIL